MRRVLRRFAPIALLTAVAVALPARGQTAGTCAFGTATTDLSMAGVRARLFNNGRLFWNGAGAVYNVPKAPDGEPVGPNALYTAALWLGGYAGTELRSVATTYGNRELWPGPLTASGELPNPSTCTAYDRIYRVTRADVEAYRASGATTADLRDWPVALGAPVIDGDGVAGNYNLAGGDRPEILGTETAWWVMNDVGARKTVTLSAPIGLEVQVTAFAMVSADPVVNRATLYRYRFVNRSAQPLTDAYAGMWTESEIGHRSDDHVGSDSARSLAYAYNADNYDEGPDGYGLAPPALGLRVLEGPLVPAPGQTWTDADGTVHPNQRRLGLGGMLYFDGNSSNHGRPRQGTSDFYHYLKSVWQNGSPIRACGNGDDTARRECPVTHFMFSGDPETGQGWSERNLYPGLDGPSANAPNDTYFVASVGPFTVPAGGEQTFTFAYVYTRGTSNLNSVTALKSASDRLQSVWNSGAFQRGSDGSAPSPITAAPGLRAPGNGATAQPTPVLLTWDALPGDVSYDLQIGRDASFAPDATVTIRRMDPSHSFAPDSTGRPYHWRVRGVSTPPIGANIVGPWSEAWTFTSTPRAVVAPSLGFEFQTVANAAGPLVPPEPGAFGSAGFPVPAGRTDPGGTRQQATGGLRADQGWGLFTFGASSTYSDWWNRVSRSGANQDEIYGASYEWRFTGSSKALKVFEDNTLVDVPFELWSLGRDPDSPADDVRMIPLVCEAVCRAGSPAGVFDIGGDSPVSPGADDPISDAVYWVYPTDRTPGQVGYAAYARDPFAPDAGIGEEVWARMTLVGRNFGTSSYPLALPERGTVFRIRRTFDVGTAPALATPTNGTALPGPSVALRWTGGMRDPAASSDSVYPVEVQVARDAAFTDLVVQDTVDTGAYTTPYVAALPAGGRYVWRVRHLFALAAAPWSETWAFTVGTGTAGEAVAAPLALTLDAPRPNPARGMARLRVGLPSGGAARVEVFDVLGRRVAVAHDGPLAAGWTDVALGTEPLPSGVYVVRLTSGRSMRTQTLVVTR